MLLLLPLLLRLVEPTLPPPQPLLREKGGREASFVPAPLLEPSRHAESADIDPAAEAILRGMIDEAYKQMEADPVSAAQECAVPVLGDTIAEFPGQKVNEAVPPEAILLNSETTVLARVVGVDPGWDLLDKKAASLVYARVVDVFRNKTGSLEAGQTITFMRDSASFRIGERRFCTRDPKTKPPPIGSLVVVAGELDPANEGHVLVNQFDVFSVRDGHVLPPPALFDRAPIPMERLRPTARRSQ